MLSPKVMLMSTVHATAESHVVIHGPAAAGDHVDAHALYYHQRPCRFSWPMPQSEAMLMSVAHAATMGTVGVMAHVAQKVMFLSVVCAAVKSHMTAYSPFCLQKLCGSP